MIEESSRSTALAEELFCAVLVDVRVYKVTVLRLDSVVGWMVKHAMKNCKYNQCKSAVRPTRIVALVFFLPRAHLHRLTALRCRSSSPVSFTTL